MGRKWYDEQGQTPSSCSRHSLTVNPSLLQVTLDSLDLSLFTKLKWPTFKPQLEKVKRRLECIRMDICLLVGMHKAISG